MNDKNLKMMLEAYIKRFRMSCRGGGMIFWAGPILPISIEEINFRQLQKENAGETFSKMLLRLIDESGEKKSVIYTRANIDRRHFSKIVNHEDYKPSKQTVLAFAIALELDFDKTQKLLASAGYILNKSILSDLIVSFFIEYKIFNVILVNQALYEYKQPLLGS